MPRSDFATQSCYFDRFVDARFYSRLFNIISQGFGPKNAVRPSFIRVFGSGTFYKTVDEFKEAVMQ